MAIEDYMWIRTVYYMIGEKPLGKKKIDLIDYNWHLFLRK